jgi:hypothetical protein
MKNQVKTWVDDELFTLVKAVVGNGSIANFLREAIQEKINNLQQNRKDINANITNNVDTKVLENMINEVTIQNKVLFEQQQKYLELFKLILRRSTSGALNAAELLKHLVPHVSSKSIGEELVARLKIDIESLKL